MQPERTIPEVVAKTATYGGAASAILTAQQWSGVFIGLVGLMVTIWLGWRRDAREARQRAEEHQEHLERMEKLSREPERRKRPRATTQD